MWETMIVLLRKAEPGEVYKRKKEKKSARVKLKGNQGEELKGNQGEELN